MVGANRKTGIDLIGEVPWGTHLCQFYQTREDLIDILVPYFKAGLENNEFCMWVTSEPLGMEEAKRAMRRAVPQFDLYLQKGQIEIIPHTEWYLKDGTFDLNRVLDAWVDKLNRALAKGYDGMRLTGNTAWLEKRDWKSFADYEEAIDNAIGKHRMLAICTYSLDKCGASEIIDVVSNHQFALIRREGEWELIESSERKQAEEKLKQIAEGWKVTFDSITDLVSIQDKDFRLLRVNKAFADTFKMEPEELIGKPCYEIVHGTGEPWPGCPHKQALETKKPVTKEFFEPQLGIHLEASASPIFSEKGEVIGTVHITKDITERKCAEEALQESEDKFKKLFEFAPDGYYLNDLKGNFVDSNKAAEELVGYKRGELIGKSFLKLRLLSSKQIPKAAALLTKNAMGQPTGPDEFILNRKDGSRVPVEIMTFPVKIKDHALVLGIARDITKRKKAEEALRESEIKFRGFVENLDGIAVRGDMEGKPEFLIGKLEDITGYTWEDFSKKGLKWFDIIHPDDKKELTEEGLKDAASGKSIDREYRIVRKDGSIRWVSQRISPQMKENGTPEFFQGIIMDITDRKQADETIKNLAKFPSENKNPVMRISKDGTITYANSASSQLLKTWKCQAGQRVPEDIQQSIQDAMSSNLGKTIEITIEDRICSLTVIPIKDAGYANLYGLDITKRKQAEEKLEKSERLTKKQLTELRKLDRMKNEFLSVVSHELRTPLTPIQAYIDLLQSGEYGELNYEQNKVLDICLESSKRLKSMIDDLMEITKLESRKVELSTEKVDLTKLIDRVLKELKPKADEKNMRVSYKRNIPPSVVWGDKNKLRAVIDNLVGNAIKFTPDGGMIWISVKEGKRGVHFNIKDNGIGIPEEHQSRIFDKFHQVDTSASREFEGMGLGLAICKEIIDLHGGRIWLKSKPSEGSEFHFNIPIR